MKEHERDEEMRLVLRHFQWVKYRNQAFESQKGCWKLAGGANHRESTATCLRPGRGGGNRHHKYVWMASVCSSCAPAGAGLISTRFPVVGTTG